MSNPIILTSKLYYSSIVAVLKIRTFLKEKSGKVVHKWETLTLFQWNCPAEGHKLIVTMKKLITFLSVVFVRKEKIWWFFILLSPRENGSRNVGYTAFHFRHEEIFMGIKIMYYTYHADLSRPSEADLIWRYIFAASFKLRGTVKRKI